MATRSKRTATPAGTTTSACGPPRRQGVGQLVRQPALRTSTRCSTRRADGIGVKRSRDLERWTGHGLLTLGQREWPWAEGRITTGQVLDLRTEPETGRCVMFFHGSSPAGCALQEVHGHASLGIAWGHDLVRRDRPRGSGDD